MHSARHRETAPRRAPAGRRRSRRARRRGRGRPAVLLLAVVLLGATAYVVLGGGRHDTSSAAPRPRTTHPEPDGTTAAPSSSAPPLPSPSPSPSPSHSPSRTPKPSGSPSPSPDASSSKGAVPATGSGRFVTALAGGATTGRGAHPLRYQVEVESGIGVSPSQAAAEIAGILAAARGWTHNPSYAFQLVGAGEAHDLTVRIATAGTADALCWAGIHQDTGGEYNCEVPGGVVVNLKRWLEGSPTFDGPIHDYRALIINHEMGHFLGYSHMACPGPGRPAPVMMQQIKGLHGCVANAWPYEANGTFASGPPAT